jgi:hypothetical protein
LVLDGLFAGALGRTRFVPSLNLPKERPWFRQAASCAGLLAWPFVRTVDYEGIATALFELRDFSRDREPFAEVSALLPVLSPGITLPASQKLSRSSAGLQNSVFAPCRPALGLVLKPPAKSVVPVGSG